MIKMLLTWPLTGRQVLLLGLSARNVELLQRKKPIHLNAEDFSLSSIPPIHEIYVIYGQTEDEMEKELREKGWITPETEMLVVTKAPVM